MPVIVVSTMLTSLSASMCDTFQHLEREFLAKELNHKLHNHDQMLFC